MRWGAIPWAIGAALSIAPAAADAAYYCSEPDEPYCLSRYGSFEEEWEFDRCRREVQNFVSEVEDFASCLDQAKQEKIDEANQAVERFNCKANGETFCP